MPSVLPNDDLAESLSNMKGWTKALWDGDKNDAREAFRAMRAWWKEHAAPVNRQRRVDGVLTTVPGLAIPDPVRNLVMKLATKNPNARSPEVRYNLLNIAVNRKMSQVTEWALLGGWNPNFYGSLVTPVGQAIYTSDVKSLELMRDFGADLVLELRPEHGSPERPLLEADLGSTALHRVMAKADAGHKAEVVRILVEAYPDPLPRTRAGLTPLDLAVDGVGVDIIRQEVARREHATMVEWARQELPSDAADTRPRVRL